MAAGNLVQEFCEETTCSICLEYFTDPVIIYCGHNFCQACLTQYWEEPDRKASCPQCRETFPEKTFRPNWQLANLVELVKKLKMGKGREEKRGLCERHQEPLKLFCEDDQAPICVVCDRSREHREHAVIPREEAFEEYKKKFQDKLQSLENQREKLMEQKVAEEQRDQKCLTLLQEERQKSLSAFAQMQKFIEKEKCFRLAFLDGLKKRVEKRQENNITRLSEEISNLSNLITEMERKCQQPAREFLQGIGGTLNRYEKTQQRQPVEVSPGLEKILETHFQTNSGLKNAAKIFEGPLAEALHKVNVTLDPNTAHPHLILSKDLKSLKLGARQGKLPDNPERFNTEFCVLGCEKFALGRHWWEVEVEEEEELAQYGWLWEGEGQLPQWVVGVARESVQRKGEISLNPEGGFWAVQKSRHYGGPFSQLVALTSPKPTALNSASNLRKIRVSLDCEKSHVAFSDAETDKLIFAFPSASFSGEGIYPFFSVYSGVNLKC